MKSTAPLTFVIAMERHHYCYSFYVVMNSKIICGNFFYNVFSLKFKWIAFVQVTVGRDQKT